MLRTDEAPEDAGDASRLDALLRLARVSRDRPLQEVFQAVAEVVERVVGFAITVVNVYRPAWDDYQVVLVHGSDAARDALLHVSFPRELWVRDLLRPEYEHVPGAFFIPGEEVEAWQEMEQSSYTPELWELGPAGDHLIDHPDRWRPEDAVLLSLCASDGSDLGVLSLDAPSTGRRPTRADLEMLVAVANHAALALENAQTVAASEMQRTALAGLLDVSARLTEQTSRDDVLATISGTIVQDMGFGRMVVKLRAGQGFRSWPGNEVPVSTVSVADVETLMQTRSEHGCVLVLADEIACDLGLSSMNGRGPHAWQDHRLLVPLYESRGELAGVFVLDDPLDRLLPTPQRRAAWRLLADRTGAALDAVGRHVQLLYLASHDPLTGVRNRRELDDTIEALAAGPGGVSLLLCDLDNFKRVNDMYGHDTGDQVLECFGQVLRAHSRADDVPFRIGGEEFCLLLPRIDADGALVAGERLRRAAAAAMSDLVPSSTVSIGIVTSGPGLREAGALMEAADRALYAAKKAGRNRCVSVEELRRSVVEQRRSVLESLDGG
jgi:diguanylate cyclase (GGDEF)-like protein